MWRTNVLLVLSLAVYVTTEQESLEHSDSQQLYCPNPNGIYPVKSSYCRKYMICHKGEPTLMECPPELVFNPQNNWCDLPQNFQCFSDSVEVVITTPVSVGVFNPPPTTSDSVSKKHEESVKHEEICPMENGAFPIPSSDCRKYKICHEGKATVMDCPSGLLFNPANHWCDLPQNVNCNTTILPAPDSIPDSTSTTTLLPMITQATVQTLTSFKDELAPQQYFCPARDGSFPVPSSDCRKYMICHEGEPTVMDCPSGLVFNPNNSWCDLPQNVRCNFSVEITPSSTSDPIHGPLPTSTTTSVTMLPEAPIETLTTGEGQTAHQQDVCPAPNGFFPVQSSDCRKYVICHEGKPTFMECPPELLFNPDNKWCDLPQNVRCNSTIVRATTLTSTPVDTSAPTSTTTSAPMLTEAPVEALIPVRNLVAPQQDFCPARDGSFPVPNSDCRKYMICHKGKPTFMDCPPGLLFNANNNWCDLPQNVHCNSSIIEVQTATAVGISAPTPATYPVSTHTQAPLQKKKQNYCNLTQILNCISNGAIAFSPFPVPIPAPTHATYPVSVHIQDPVQVQIPAGLQQAICPRQDGTFPVSSTNCSKYMFCHEGKATLMDCPSGLVFNPNNNWCDLPKNFQCNSSLVVAPVFSPFPVPMPAPTPATHPAFLHVQAHVQTLTAAHVPSVSQQPICPRQNGTFSISSHDCRKYMFCREGKATIMECPSGLVFNPNNNWCDLPQNIHCNPNVVVAPTPYPVPIPAPTPAIYPASVHIQSSTPAQVPTAPQQAICPTPNGTFPASSNDCSKYIVCHEGKATLMNCPAGLFFNPNNNWCDLRQNVNCNSSNVVVPVSTPAPVHILPSSMTNSVSAYTEAPVQASSPAQVPEVPQQEICPRRDGIFTVSSSNCRKYMLCREGQATIMECPSGLAFNQNKNICDLPENAPCHTSITPSPILRPARTLAAVSTLVSTPVAAVTSVPSPAPVSAPAPAPAPTQTPASDSAPAPAPTSTPASALGVVIDFNCQQTNGYHAVPNECDTYIVCERNLAYKVLCPDGFHFNPEAKYPEYACAHSSKVECASGVAQNATATIQCPRQYGFFPLSDSECSKYIRCHGGKATVMNCPHGLAFNPVNNTCDWPENVPLCNPDVFKGFTCPDAVLLGNAKLSDIIIKYRYKNHCNMFVACHKGFPRLLKCEGGKSFDESLQACNNSAYVTNCEVNR